MNVKGEILIFSSKIEFVQPIAVQLKAKHKNDQPHLMIIISRKFQHFDIDNPVSITYNGDWCA